MSANTPIKKKPVVKKKPTQATRKKRLDARKIIGKFSERIVARVRGILSRRPHRSFRRTRRRDYIRSLKLPGYWAFTGYVWKTLWQNKVLFIWLMLVYGLLTTLLVGMAAQDTYSELSGLLRDTGGEFFKGGWNSLGQAGLLLVSGMTGRLNMQLTDAQQMYAVIIGLFTWLTTVWLLRAVLAGRKPKLRDGLYNAGSPVLPTFLVMLALAIQLIPVAIVVIGFTALVPFGILEGGIEAMLFWAAALLLIGLSLYWITSTLIALVVVTLPGMYPMQAIRTAGDMVIGRRVRILFRLLWLLLVVAMAWVVIMIPLILFDTWLKGVLPAIEWLPTIPVALLIMGTLTTIWTASYVYLLYRRIVDDDAAPA